MNPEHLHQYECYKNVQGHFAHFLMVMDFSPRGGMGVELLENLALVEFSSLKVISLPFEILLHKGLGVI